MLQKKSIFILAIFILLFSGCGSSSPATNERETPDDDISTEVINNKPIAHENTINATENDSVTITLSAQDSDGDAISYNYTSPSHGSLTGTAPNLTYTPTNGYNGSDSFTFIANDGKEDSTSATINITIQSTNVPPVTTKANDTTKEEGSEITFTTAVYDADGDALTYLWEEGETILSTSQNFSKDDFSVGEHTITFTVTDAEGAYDSDEIIITITSSNNQNDAPVATNQSFTTDEDISKVFTLNANDVENDTLTMQLISQPAHGHLEGTLPLLTYVPDANYFGNDSITYRVNDGRRNSNTATITIMINSINDNPVINDIPDISVVYLQTVSLFAVANDIDSTQDTCVWKEANTVLSTTHRLTKDDFSVGEHILNAIVSDNDGGSTTMTVKVTITNNAPTADSKTIKTNKNTAVSLTLSGADADNHSFTYGVSNNPSHGTLSGTAPTLTYTPDNGFSGNDTFTYRTFDGAEYSQPATISIQVNVDPVANAGQEQSIAVGESITLTGTGSDSDGTVVSYQWRSGDQTIISHNASVNYTPTKMGQEKLTLTVTDNLGATASDYVTITAKKELALIIIQIEFNDYQFDSPTNVWSSKIFGYNEGQLNHYYQEISHGAFKFLKAKETDGTVNDGIITVQLNRNHPGDVDFANRLVDAINLSDNYINYAQYDTNGDNAISRDELQIMFLVAGGEASTGLNPGIWAHQWSLFGGNADAPTLDGVKVMDFATGGNYSRFGESHFQHDLDASIGVIAHELGHAAFGLPDLYDTTGIDSEGIGKFGLMGSGSWGRKSWQEQAGATPTHMTGWSKLTAGFIKAKTITQDSTNVAFKATTYMDYQLYKIATSHDGEYFLLENRANLGYDRGLFTLAGDSDFAGGLSILHIDENVNNDGGYNNNNDVTHKLVDVEEANDAGLDDKTDRGHINNLFFHANANSFTTTTTPNSKLYDGSASGFSINNISTVGDTMHADIEIQ